MLQEPSRNSVCPCESGKKYKYCCSINLDPKSCLSKITLENTRDIEESPIIESDKQRFKEISECVNVGKTDFKLYLKELIQIKYRNPKEKRIYNLISVCYSQLGQNKKAIEVVQETYRLFPDYLFAKTSMMRMAFYENNHQKYLEFFGGNFFDLQTLYPDREIFHISEALDFYNVAGTYLAREKKFYLAHQCLKILFSLSPNNEVTFQLDEELHKQLQVYEKKN